MLSRPERLSRSRSTTPDRFPTRTTAPRKGVRFASVDKTGAYLLLPARWFPLTNYPSNRYTGTFKITVPDNFAVVGTGKADPPNLMPGIGKGAPGQASYVFHCAHAAPVGSIRRRQPCSFRPCKPKGSTSPSLLRRRKRIPPIRTPLRSRTSYSYFSDAFGPLEMKEDDPPLTIAQLPDGTLPGFAAPGLMLISARQWGTKAQRSPAFAIGRRTVVG